MARVLILTGDAAEELDSMYPVFRIREAGQTAVVAAHLITVSSLASVRTEPEQMGEHAAVTHR